jgi:hypothetical protein
MSSAIAVFRMCGWRPSGISTEVIIGLFAREAEQIWSDWNLLIRISLSGGAVSRPVRSGNGPRCQSKRCLFLRGMLSALHN